MTDAKTLLLDILAAIPDGEKVTSFFDVSPAVWDYLGLGALDVVDWRFVEQAEVPTGPWSLL